MLVWLGNSHSSWLVDKKIILGFRGCIVLVSPILDILSRWNDQPVEVRAGLKHGWVDHPLLLDLQVFLVVVLLVKHQGVDALDGIEVLVLYGLSLSEVVVDSIAFNLLQSLLLQLLDAFEKQFKADLTPLLN